MWPISSNRVSSLKLTVSFLSAVIQLTCWSRLRPFPWRFKHWLRKRKEKEWELQFTITGVFTVPKFAISQSEAVSTVLISCDIKSLTWYGYDIMVTWPNLGTINTDFKHLKSLWNIVIGEMFGSLGVIFKEKLNFKNCKISGWQKRYWVHTFFVKCRVFKPAPHKKYSINRAQIPWDI